MWAQPPEVLWRVLLIYPPPLESVDFGRMNFSNSFSAKLCRPGVHRFKQPGVWTGPFADNEGQATGCLKRLRLDGITLPKKILKNSFYRNLYPPTDKIILLIFTSPSNKCRRKMLVRSQHHPNFSILASDYWKAVQAGEKKWPTTFWKWPSKFSWYIPLTEHPRKIISPLVIKNDIANAGLRFQSAQDLDRLQQLAGDRDQWSGLYRIVISK